MRQAVILAGGKGTRLAERLNGLPKPLVDVAGVPLLERQLNALSDFGVTSAIVLVNHAADQIEAYIASRQRGPVVQLIDDGNPRGTAGAVLGCLDSLDDEFLVVYGDTLFDIDIDNFWSLHSKNGADVSLFLHPNDHPHDSDLVELNEQGEVLAFRGYPHPEGSEYRNLVNAALYIIRKEALQSWRNADAPMDFAKDLFPEMLSAGKRFFGYNSFEYIKDLGTPKRLDKVVRHLTTGVVERARRSSPQKAVFIDRDGTLNHLRGYISKREQLDLLPGAAEAVAQFNDAEYRVALITNQPVIARGECTREGLAAIHGRLETLLGQGGAYLDATYYCPHHPDSGFQGEVQELKIQCDCRKPGTKMLEAAAAHLNVDLTQSWVIGDSTADISMANKIGVPGILVRTGEGGRDGKNDAHADLVCQDVLEAANLITQIIPEIEQRLECELENVAAGTLIQIGGLSRSGKSVVATALKRLLSRRQIVISISLDRWLRPLNSREEGLLGRYDLQATEVDLKPWLVGGSHEVTFPTYNRISKDVGRGATIKLASEASLILEGVPSLLNDWHTSRPTLKIWVETDEKVRRQRLLSDLMLNRSLSEALAKEVIESRAVDEDQMVSESKFTADIKLYLANVRDVTI